MSILHPTGSEAFERMLSASGHPAPWRLDDDAPGELLDASGATAVICGTKDDDAELSVKLAVAVMLAVNTLAGYRAVRVGGNG